MPRDPVAAPQREPRIPLAVALRISGYPQVPGFETAFTENVSPRGARVVSERRWEPNDQLAVASLSGDFRTMARVVYCQSLQPQSFAIGVEFLEPVGTWVTGAAGFGK